MILADGQLREVAFEARIEKSSWVALRILPSSHSNPIFVLVATNRSAPRSKSAEWCLQGWISAGRRSSGSSRPTNWQTRSGLRPRPRNLSPPAGRMPGQRANQSSRVQSPASRFRSGRSIGVRGACSNNANPRLPTPPRPTLDSARPGGPSGADRLSVGPRVFLPGTCPFVPEARQRFIPHLPDPGAGQPQARGLSRPGSSAAPIQAKAESQHFGRGGSKSFRCGRNTATKLRASETGSGCSPANWSASVSPRRPPKAGRPARRCGLSHRGRRASPGARRRSRPAAPARWIPAPGPAEVGAGPREAMDFDRHLFRQPDVLRPPIARWMLCRIHQPA